MSDDINKENNIPDDYTSFDGNTEDGQRNEEVKISHLSGMYEEYFIDYASYVILERAVPHITDGLKPVQRRIMHAMKRLDDGRYNKVANIIGYSMQFHPHGDTSIGDALVQVGQKDLLVDMQGNWGNIFTGDRAAASRYIEARLSVFASDVVFNPKTTNWKLSYDGRNKEPIALPVKFPLLLAQGAEGIAVGLSSKILPHNFNELIDASIRHLQEKDFEIYPDFPTGGYADFSRYNDGRRGGSIRVRAKIEKLDKKTLVIRDLPFGKTTGTLIESIIKANEKGKIKIKKIDDNTAEFVEIQVHLAPNISSDKTIDALYAFTDCEFSISPNCCVIEDNKPKFTDVSDVLRVNTENTKNLLLKELEIRLAELQENWHMSSLEKIFIEERIYRDIEEAETWEAVIEAINKGLDPFKKLFHREITREDIIKLTEIKIKRISKFDVKKADEQIKGIEEEISEVKNHLAHIIDFAINYYKQIKKKHGKGRDRKTEIRSFENIVATKVVVANEKLYANKQDGFVGTGLKKDEYVCDCSDIDDVIVFLKDGSYVVNKVSDKFFVGKNIIHVAVFKKQDKRTIYNAIYYDGNSGNAMMKRCSITGVTRDKLYNIGRAHKYTKVLYMTVNPNGEAETVKVTLRPKARLKKLVFEMDFSELVIKGRNSMGNILTKNSVHKVTMKEKGVSTLGGRKIWFDEDVNRLNADARGIFLGEFSGENKILVITKTGNFRTTNFDLSNHFEDDVQIVEKYRSKKIWSAAYFDAEQEYYYIKRFNIEPSEKPSGFIGDHPESRLMQIMEVEYPRLELKFGGKNKDRGAEIIEVADFISVKSYKARGKRLSNYEVKIIEQLEPLIADSVVEDEAEDIVETNGVDETIADDIIVDEAVADKATKKAAERKVVEDEKTKPKKPAEKVVKQAEPEKETLKKEAAKNEPAKKETPKIEVPKKEPNTTNTAKGDELGDTKSGANIAPKAKPPKKKQDAAEPDKTKDKANNPDPKTEGKETDPKSDDNDDDTEESNGQMSMF